SGGAVLALDDLHEADLASLDWLGNLVRQLKGAPLGVVVTYRHAETTPALLRWRDHLDRLRIRPDIPLQEPDVEGVAELAQHTGVAPSLAPRLWQATGGTPFFVLETLHAIREQSTYQPPVPQEPNTTEQMPGRQHDAESRSAAGAWFWEEEQ